MFPTTKKGNDAHMENAISWLVNDSEDFQFLLFFGLFGVLMLAERLFQFRSLKRKSRWATNFSLTALAVMVMMLQPITFISASLWAEQNGLGLFNWLSLPVLVVLPGSLLLRGGISFLTHWLMHRVPFLWRIHRVHHLDTEMDVSTTVRFHPFEFIANALIGIPMVAAMGFPAWILLLYELLDVAVTLFSHSNISLPQKLEKGLRYVIVTPDLHRVHHSARRPETDSNFSAVFPIWDLLMGTFRTQTQVPANEMRIGLEEVRDKRTRKVLWLLKSPFTSFKNQKKTSL